jgi:predicted dehydrogenase
MELRTLTYKMKYFALFIVVALAMMSCKQNDPSESNESMISIMTIAPGHFHAALIQKHMYPQVDSQVYVYAPEGPDVSDYLSRIEAFNSRKNNPTAWKNKLYTGDDFFEKMLEEKPGNLVTLAGNNEKKTEYILACIQGGLNVYSDKPMAIQTSDFELLKEAFTLAEEKGLLLYDIMTERFEINTILQRSFSQQEQIFGTLQSGSLEDPAITKESVHHFSKIVSGIPLKRPAWFFDVEQEGEAIADVGTHLVDLIQWEAFPDEVIDYKNDIEILDSRRWSTELSAAQFKGVTGLEAYPEYLRRFVEDDTLKAIANSSVQYTLRGIHSKVSVEWKYVAPEGAGDTHYSIMRGTLSDLIIRQGTEEGFKPTLYIRAADENIRSNLRGNIELYVSETLAVKYPGLSVEVVEPGLWRVNIPNKYRIGHEAHFEQVTKQFLEYMAEGRIPQAEVQNMIAKYYTTTAAVEMAK